MIETDKPFVATGARSDIGPGETSPGGDNIVDLVRQLAGQGSHLAEQQLSLVKAEMREATNDLKTSIGALVGGAVVGMAGLGVTLMGVAFLVGQAIDNVALATLLVGLATLGLAYLLYSSGSKKMSNAHLTPERSQRTLERTPDVARGGLHTEQSR